MADTAMPLTNKMTGEEEKMVKDKVQEKLEEYLSSVTDTVLCDYVLVMLGNKKNKGQVTNDLEVPLPTRPPLAPPPSSLRSDLWTSLGADRSRCTPPCGRLSSGRRKRQNLQSGCGSSSLKSSVMASQLPRILVRSSTALASSSCLLLLLLLLLLQLP
jgi:hypothetical protein